MNEILDEMERQREALESRLSEIHEESPDYHSKRNAIQASNTVAYELGTFSTNQHSHGEMPDEMVQGLIARGRMDALSASLNSGQALDQLMKLSAQLESIRGDIRQTKTMVAILFGAAIALLLFRGL
jgi:predicted RNase H-like nuclease (RuvC/YqgF family)